MNFYPLEFWEVIYCHRHMGRALPSLDLQNYNNIIIILDSFVFATIWAKQLSVSTIRVSW